MTTDLHPATKLPQPFDLSGRVAVITGASRGLGKVSAQALAQAGAKVVISSRNAATCEATAAQINAELAATQPTGTGQAIAQPCNIAHKDQLQTLVNVAEQRWGAVDIVICNAAIHPWVGSITELPDDSFDKFFRANLHSALWLSQMTLPQMAARGWGRFILVSSLGAQLAETMGTAYGMTKVAGQRLVQGLAAEFAHRGVSANAIVPGTFATDMSRHVMANEAWLLAHNTRSPARRVGQPSEFAGLALLLASDAASYIHGQCIHIDGGYSIAY